MVQKSVPFSDFALAEDDNITGVDLYSNSDIPVPAFWIDITRLVKRVALQKTVSTIEAVSMEKTVSQRQSRINTTN